MDIKIVNIQLAQEQYVDIVTQYLDTFPLTINTKLNNFAELILDKEEKEHTINAVVELLCAKKVCLILINFNNTNTIDAMSLFNKLLTEKLYKPLITSPEICVYGMFHSGLLFGEVGIKL